MSSSQKPKFSIRKSFHKGLNSIIKPIRSQEASREPSSAPASSTHSSSPDPRPSLSVNRGPTLLVEFIPGFEPAPADIPVPSSGPVRRTVASLTPTLAPASQPTQSIPATTGVWAGLEKSLRTLHGSTKLFSQQLSKNHTEREELALELTVISKLLAKYPQQSSSGQMSEAVARAVKGIEEQVKIIESRRDRGAGWRFLEADAEEELLDLCYRRIGSLFRQLQADANLSMWNLINDQMANTRLEGLAPAKLANFDSKLSTSINRRTCTANTRTTILSGLDDWSHESGAANVYWMNGMAGTGKTTIACTFAESLAGRMQLAASFFCTRTSPKCRDATRILPTIAYQLARYSVPFQSELCKALDKDPDASAKNITKQFETLLKQPLLAVKEAIAGDLVVIIDALDECSDIREVELLLSVLLKNAADVPIKFFVTSRPEPEIYAYMRRRDSGRAVLHLHEVERSLVQADIELYLAEELQSISPSPSQIQELARRSGALFIYAATLVRYICLRGSRSDPHYRLASVLSTKVVPAKQYSEVDALYATVLQAALNDPELEDEETGNIRRVLHTVICAQEPVAISTLTELAGLAEEKQALMALEPLRAVLHFSESNRLITTLHASFPDFMFDKTRSKTYFCSLSTQNADLAQRCFAVMETQLRFNICSLDSSYLPDSEVENLDERAENVISSALWYACRFWADHLKQGGQSELICTLLDDFLSNQLLFWMEVLNLNRQIGMSQDILWEGKQWLTSGKFGNTDLVRHAEDARNFATSFAANPVSRRTPHLYISSLPLCPKSSFVFRQYYQKGTGLIDVAGSAMKRSEGGALASWQVGSEVISIAYSPDGTRIVSGSRDNSIRVWNAQDGALTAGPLQGHTESVSSVVYSPDSTRIASGSRDKTIRVWDAQDGTLVAGPLKGHTEWISSVAYSPDGTRIVSGSYDKTIRVWNADDGTLVAGPLQGHTRSVSSVAYSPDGARILSGSNDKTIRVWNARDGTLVAGPLSHTEWISSVAYSPDGSRIVSGSRDKTIRVWDAQYGTLVAGLLQGHTESVTSVAYSPDGTRIVSGSRDKTIRVWNAHDGTLVAGPLQGHTEWVSSVVYSPDGTRIVSGSRDKTIRVWNAQDGTLVAGLLQGHTEWISSVAYSPDGTRIVSGSGDKTIREWDAHDGTLVAGPLKGHTEWVSSVAYSPDGTRLISGSRDKAIRVWNADDGTLVTGPLQGHTEWVSSVAYSPDGSRIVSGSKDKTLRVWDAQDGTLIAGPLEGHTGWISSVAYSPDSTRIVSGSGDKTVRVWNAHDGTLIADPLKGHTHEVSSVAYSPDGTHIVSGSNDKTIRVWNADDGTLATGPLQGHTEWVSSVAYSPDGTRIVSGSRDKTVRVWNAQDGTLVAGPLKGHTEWISSVAYSPDGTRVVSGSRDKTIRVWDVQEGALVTDPLHGYPRSVGSVPHSPDGTRIVSGPGDMTTQGRDACPPSLPTGSSLNSNLLPHTSCVTSSNGPRFVEVTEDGWVVGCNSQLLFWIPYDLRFTFISLTSRCIMIIDEADSLAFRHGRLFIGEQWAQCFQT